MRNAGRTADMTKLIFNFRNIAKRHEKENRLFVRHGLSCPPSLSSTGSRLYLNFIYIHPFVENLCMKLQRISLQL